MAEITYILTNSSYISEIEERVGNLLFCEDNKRIYLDSTNGRVCYDSIMVFDKDSERVAYATPLDGFYYVGETKILWRYSDGAWEAITEPPTNIIIFIPKADLPVEGEAEKLYVCGNEIYVWKDEKYEQITADSVWREV